MGLFLQSLVMAIFVKLRPMLLENILRESVELGAHSGIIVYTQQGGIYEYVWAHPVTRPLGVVLPLNCGTCGHLGPWLVPELAISALPTMTNFSCAKCPNTFQCLILALCHITPKSRGVGGEWFAQCLDGPSMVLKMVKWSYINGVLTGNAALGEDA